MSKCLVTTLKGIVNDEDLLKIGEFKIKVNTVDSPSNKTQGITVRFSKNTTLTIEGNGNFTDKDLSENRGKTLDIVANTTTYVYFSNGDFNISFPDKYSLTSLSLFAEEVGSDSTIQNKSVSTESFEFSKDIDTLRLSAENVTGDFASVKNLSKLTALNISKVDVYGDISAIKYLNKLTYINMEDTSVTGDVSSIANLGSLKRFAVTNLYGDLSKLNRMTSLTELLLKKGTFYGDIAILPPTLNFLSLQYDNGSTLTWSKRPSSSTIFSIEGSPKVSNIDKMLQDLAACQTPSTEQAIKVISATGKRTSASDSAVSALQSKGYTVTIISL